MTQDNGMDVPDNRAPISKKGLLAALEESMKLIEMGYYQVARENLRKLHRNVRDERLVAKEDHNGH